MKLIEITPKAFLCTAAACPAVYTTEKGDKLAIVGRKVDNPEEIGINEKIGKDEQVVIVDREMLRQIFER